MVTQASEAQIMTPKERMIRALNGYQTDVIPAAPAYLSLFLADIERSLYIEQYRLRLRDSGLQCYPVDHAEDTLFRARATYQSYEVFKVRPDLIEADTGVSRAWAEKMDVVEQDDQLFFEDRVSGKRVAMPNARLYQTGNELTDINPSESDITDLSAEISGPDDADRIIQVRSVAELLESGELDLLRQLVADYGERYFISYVMDTPYCDVSDYLGFFGLMTTIHDRPSLLHHMLERQLAQSGELIAALSSIGLHGVYVQEIFSGADMISPQAYAEFVFPYNKRYFKEMGKLGLLPIHLVCGDVMPRLDQMACYDLAAIAVEESKKNFRIEIEEVVERVGDKVAVLGNIDAVQFGPHASPEEMAAEVKRQVFHGSRARGFIASTGSPFPLDTHPDQIEALVRTAHSLPG